MIPKTLHFLINNQLTNETNNQATKKMLKYKRRTLYTYVDISEDKISYKNLIYNQNLAGSIQLTYIHTITPEEINQYLRMFIEIPTLLARQPFWRSTIFQRSSYYMKYRSEIIDKDVREILEQFFDWLKERNDYVESPEDKIARIEKERNIARGKQIKVELIEILYHPDRYERMVASYGEIWADVHLPC